VNGRLGTEEARQALLRFARQRGEAAIRLAMHAAVPQTFRPELLHLLRLNFVPEARSDAQAVESDVMLAPFCASLGAGFYQLDAEVRRQLVDHLAATYAQERPSRLRRVAAMLLAYLDAVEGTRSREGSLLGDRMLVERWVAAAFLEPAETAGQFARALAAAGTTQPAAVRVQLGGLAPAVALPLGHFPDLLAYAQAVAAIEQGDEAAAGPLVDALPAGPIDVMGVKLANPRSLRPTVAPAPVATATTAKKAEPVREGAPTSGRNTRSWYEAGLECARSVARIEDLKGGAFGTGFLVRPGDFFRSWSPQLEGRLLLTAAHVLSRDRAHPGALRPVEAVASFDDRESRTRFGIHDVVWEDPDLDAIVLLLESGPPRVKACRLSPPQEPVVDPKFPRRLGVIGYPQGGSLSISLEDSVQTDWRPPHVYYRTPTGPGTAGSPVFDEEWNVVALHQARTNDLGQGMWIHEIVRQTRRATARVAPANEPSPTDSEKRPRIFISYSHKDQSSARALQQALAPLVETHDLELWDDRRIKPDVDWRSEITGAIERATVAVLLVSADYLASAFIGEVELPRILEAARTRRTRVCWIAVSHSQYESTPIANFQAANDPERPLTSLTAEERTNEWTRIAAQVSEMAAAGQAAGGTAPM
jgi:hypothetical protein